MAERNPKPEFRRYCVETVGNIPLKAGMPISAIGHRISFGFRPSDFGLIFRLIALNFTALIASAQPSNQPDPLMLLMQSQPSIVITAPTQVVAAFDPPIVRAGQEATYRISLDALLDSIELPEKLPKPDGLSLRPSARGQTFRPLANAIQPISAFNFRARSDQTGAFIIPAFTLQAYGKSVTVPAARLEVVDASVTNTQAALRLALELPAGNLFIGQSVNVRVLQRGTSQGVIQGLSQVEFNGDGIMADRNFVQQRIESATVNGINIPVLIYETVIIPLRAGNIPITAQGFQSGNMFGGQITITGPAIIPGGLPGMNLVDSDPVTLTVRPLPKEGELPGFTGGIGAFTLDPPALATNTIQAGEPVKLLVTIRGQGNLSRLVPPDPQPMKEWQVFTASRDATPPPLIQARGFTTFTYTIIPLSAEVRGTPPIPFSYFNPERGVYSDLTIPSVPLTVKPSLQPTDTQALAQAESPGAGEAKEPDLSELATARGEIAASLVPLPLRTWFPFVQIAPVLGFVALWAWDRRRRFLEAHPDILIRLRARRELHRARRELRNAIRQGDAAGVVSWGVKAMRVAVAPHFPAEPRALVGADVLSLLEMADRQGQAGATVRHFFEIADAGQFDSKPTDSNGLLAAHDGIEQVLDQLEEKL